MANLISILYDSIVHLKIRRLLMQTHKYYLNRFLILGTLLISTAVWASGPTIAVGKVTGKAGSVVDLPITLDPGSASIAGIQFDLSMPANTSIESTVPGPELKAEGKTISSNHRGQTWTFIVFGMNQNTNRKGTLLTAQVQVAPGTAAGKLKISATGVVYTDPNGKAITPGQSKAGTLTVQ
jgi:hypothetical protein